MRSHSSIDFGFRSGGERARPLLAETSALPAQDGVGREMMTSAWRQGQAGPQQAAGRAELRAGQRALVDGELLAQSQGLDGKLAVAAEREGRSRSRWSPTVIASRDCDRTGPSITCRADDVLAKHRPCASSGVVSREERPWP